MSRRPRGIAYPRILDHAYWCNDTRTAPRQTRVPSDIIIMVATSLGSVLTSLLGKLRTL